MSTVATRPRLGFLGVGWIGRSRLERLASSGVAEVAGVADPAEPDCLDSLDELLELDLDGLVIATPSALHAEQAAGALERGLAVFCQKPLGRTADETRRVVEAARKADRLLAVDLSYRHVGGAALIRELVQAGELGEVFAAELVFHNAYGPEKSWFYDRDLSGGGCLIDLGIHLVDLALWTLDWPQVKRASGSIFGEPVERYAVAQLELEGGAVVRLACSWHLPVGRDAAIEASFYGTAGGAGLRNVDGSFYDFVAERYRGREPEVLAQPPDDWFGRAAVEWARRLAAGERFDPEVERVVQVAEVLDAIYGSRP